MEGNVVTKGSLSHTIDKQEVPFPDSQREGSSNPMTKRNKTQLPAALKHHLPWEHPFLSPQWTQGSKTTSEATLYPYS